MRNLLFILLGLGLFGCMQRKEQCIGNVLLIPMQVYVPLYQNEEGNIIDSIINDTIQENYALIGIYQIKNDRAKVKVTFSMDSLTIKDGWIEMKYLGIHLAHYSDTIKTMLHPRLNSEISFEIKNPQWEEFYMVKNACKDWLYIQRLNCSQDNGWLAPEYQCDNPYTPCN
jgi:hypothetical protein